MKPSYQSPPTARSAGTYRARRTRHRLRVGGYLASSCVPATRPRHARPPGGGLGRLPAIRLAASSNNRRLRPRNARSPSEPTWRTPITLSSLSSGVPSTARRPLSTAPGSRRSWRRPSEGGRYASPWRYVPRNPSRPGRLPRRTSSSSPTAALATSSWCPSSKSSTAAVSAPNMSSTRSEQLNEEVLKVEPCQPTLGYREDVVQELLARVVQPVSSTISPDWPCHPVPVFHTPGLYSQAPRSAAGYLHCMGTTGRGHPNGGRTSREAALWHAGHRATYGSQRPGCEVPQTRSPPPPAHGRRSWARSRRWLRAR